MEMDSSRSISRRLRELYRSRGYSHYRMSRFEPYDLYAGNKRFLVSEDILTFTDTDGRLMALRPDVTLSIAKNAPAPGGALQKVYYHETVYRTSPAGPGFREIPQTGLECMGELDDYAMGEVLALAARSLAVISGDYVLDLGHMGLVSAALEGIDPEAAGPILRELGRKNVPAIRALCARADVPPERQAALCAMADLYGGPDQVLPRLEGLLPGKGAREALAQLRRLCALLAAAGLEKNLRLDLSLVNDTGYYTGVLFQGCLPQIASPVLAGGRYDNLLRRLGKAGGAVGFAVYLDRLERLFPTPQPPAADTLLLYAPSDDPAAVAAMAEKLAGQGGVRVEREAPEGVSFRRVVRFEKGGSF